MSYKQNRSERTGDTAYWVVAVVLILTGLAAPIGFLMIVLKLLGGGRRKRGRHPYYTQQEAGAPAGARTTGPQEAAPSPAKKKGRGKPAADPAQEFVRETAARGKKLTTIGGITAAVALVITVLCVGDALFWLPEYPLYFLEEVIPPLCFAGAGAGMLLVGLRRRKQAHRCRSYLAMIGQRKVVSVSSLSAATGNSPAKVRDDLEDMLDDGLFPSGYLDRGGDRLVLSGEGLEEEPPKEAPKPRETPGEEDAILAEIRAVNDAVDNEKLSAQIDRIGVITARILDYQRQHPDKSPQLHSFLSYYLPTTLKILRAYSQLEDQEVSGENITSAMKRIEGMMDKVVEGFEKQLDQLFQGEAMDITTDVEVLERMLARDGLSDHEGMTLGL